MRGKQNHDWCDTSSWTDELSRVTSVTVYCLPIYSAKSFQPLSVVLAESRREQLKSAILKTMRLEQLFDYYILTFIRSGLRKLEHTVPVESWEPKTIS